MKKLIVLVLMSTLSLVSLAAKPTIEPPTYVLWELGGDHIIDQHNSDSVRPMASITKLMTALVVIKSGVDLSETVTVTGAETSTRIRNGQQYTRHELLELTLVNSDNLAARTLAETTLSDYYIFLATMNSTARQLGMLNTNYDDSTGLMSGNVATPADLKILVQAVGNYDIFKQSAMMSGTTTAVHVKKKTVSKFNANTNWFAGKLDLLAAKTGTTNAAGKCLAMLFNKDGHRYVLIVMGARHAGERIKLAQNLIDKIH